MSGLPAVGYTYLPRQQLLRRAAGYGTPSHIVRRFPHEPIQLSSPPHSPHANQGRVGHGRNHHVLATDQLRAIGQRRRAAEEMLKQRLLEARGNELANAFALTEGGTESAGPLQ